MSLEINAAFFKQIVAAIVILIVIAMTVLLFKFTGGFAFLSSGSAGGSYTISDIDDSDYEYSDYTNYLQFNWEFNGKDYDISTYLSTSTYELYNYGIPGTSLPDNLTDYMICDDEGVIEGIADDLMRFAKRDGYDRNDKDIPEFVISFVKSIPYASDYDSGHSEIYPRAPVNTLADNMGDTGDHAILAATLLKEMGYGVSLINYAGIAVDKQTLIPNAVALGIKSVKGNDGITPIYRLGSPCGSSGYLTDRTASVGLFLNDEQTQDNTSASVSDSGVPSKTESIYIMPVFAADITESGYTQSTIFGYSQLNLTPPTVIIYPDESLFTAGTYNRRDTPQVDFRKSMNIPYNSFETDFEFGSPRTTDRGAGQDGYSIPQTVWYNSNIQWSYDSDNSWQFNELMLNVDSGTSAALYSPWGTAVVNTASPWRICYSIADSDSVKSQISDKKMTPYENVWFAIFEESESGLTLVRQFGWQGGYSAQTKNTAGPFGPGKYVLGVMVRNINVKVWIEFSGKPTTTSYAGSI